MTNQERAEEIADYAANISATRAGLVERIAAALDAEQRGAARVCDCGETLTVCASCAVSDYQAAHADCQTCCPSPQRGAARVTWPLIQALERACWKRKWSEVKAARKALEAEIGKRPADPLFANVVCSSPPSPESSTPKRWACLRCCDAAGVTPYPDRHITHRVDERCPRESSTQEGS